MSRIPNLPIVVTACAVAIAGYGWFSYWAVYESGDSVLIGDTIGTWKSFAVAAFAFWIGSSSGGKSNTKEPIETVVKNPPTDPVLTHEAQP